MNDIVYLGSKDNFMLLPTSFLRAIAINYPTPSSLSGLWNFGVSAFVFLAIQVFTGILLVTNYIPYIGLAAASIEHTMRDVYMGWLLRYIHISGASFYFFALYTHIARGLNYSSYSYPRANAWFSGILIFYISMLVAFSGYILPWGQMSFWAATVITNLLTIFPNGEGLVTWVWGSPTISTITLSRFFTIHFISPFILIFIVLLHVTFLHTYGSGNPASRSGESYDMSFFSPYYITKDILAMSVIGLLFVISIFFMPLALAHPDNYIPANPFVTPNHIVPEWYFLPAYAILRSCPTKLEGILAFASAIIILLSIGLLSQSGPFDASMGYTGKTRTIFSIAIICSYLMLMYIGSCPMGTTYIDLGEQATLFYFYATGGLYFLPIFVDNFIIGMISILLGPGPSHLVADSNRKNIKGDLLSTIKIIVTKFLPFIKLILTKIVSFITKIDSFITRIVHNIIAGLKNVIKKLRQFFSKSKSSREVKIIKTDWTIFLIIMGIISVIFGGYHGANKYKVYQDVKSRRREREEKLLAKYASVANEASGLGNVIIMSTMRHMYMGGPMGGQGENLGTFSEILARVPNERLDVISGQLDRILKVQSLVREYEKLSYHAQNLILYQMRDFYPIKIVVTKQRTFEEYLFLIPGPVILTAVDVFFQEQLQKIYQAHKMQVKLRSDYYTSVAHLGRAQAQVLARKNIAEIREIYECVAIIGTETIYMPVFEKHLGTEAKLSM